MDAGFLFQHGKLVDELISQLTDKLGLDPGVAQTATQKAMSMIKENAGDDLFSQISGAVPGAEEAASAEPAPTSGGGMLGKLAGMASGALGGNAGSGLEMASALTSSGLKTDQVGGFMQTLIGFIKDKAGDSVVDQLLGKFPMLKQLIG